MHTWVIKYEARGMAGPMEASHRPRDDPMMCSSSIRRVVGAGVLPNFYRGHEITGSRRNPDKGRWMNIGRVGSAALMLSGISGVLMPTRVASALDLSHVSGRGVAETRAGLGGTYAALGGWALLSRDPAAQAAVGVTWLGAAAVRTASLVVDRPRTDWTFWGYLVAEVGFGATALASAAN